MKFKHAVGPWTINTYGPSWLPNHVTIDSRQHGALAHVVYEMEDGAEPSTSMAKANAQLIAVAPEMLDMLVQQYKELANIRNQWPGRETMEGQQKLCAMRDLIAKATGLTPQEVQDN